MLERLPHAVLNWVAYNALTFNRFWILRFKRVEHELDRRGRIQTVEDIKEKFGRLPQVGDMVNDCRGQDGRLSFVDYEDDYAEVEGGFGCSFLHCLEWARYH